MKPLREVLSLHAGMSVANRLWLLGAAIVAVCLLSIYVNLLHEQVARGERLRQVLRGAPNQAATRGAVLPVPLVLTQPRHVPGRVDPQTR